MKRSYLDHGASWSDYLDTKPSPWMRTLKTLGLCVGVVAFIFVLLYGVPSL